jgi:hypothetical protein
MDAEPDRRNPSLIRSDWKAIIRINDAQSSPKRQKEIRKQINGKCSVSIADENNK